MYAIVRSGGKQHKVAVGDVIEVEKVGSPAGEGVTLPALLVVDGETVTSEAAALAGISVTAEVVAHTKGPKINILKYKNKTGYRKRQGHRQRLTTLRVTGIETASSAKPAGRKSTTSTDTTSTETTSTDTTSTETNESGQ